MPRRTSTKTRSKSGKSTERTIRRATWLRDFQPHLTVGGELRQFSHRNPEDRKELITAAAQHRVWSLCDYGPWGRVFSGVVKVNRLTFYITKIPRPPHTNIRVVGGPF